MTSMVRRQEEDGCREVFESDGYWRAFVRANVLVCELVFCFGIPSF
jgi:hypothetical protein